MGKPTSAKKPPKERKKDHAPGRIRLGSGEDETRLRGG
jgi:hypothetical protein